MKGPAVRFRNMEDAMVAANYMRDRKPVPAELFIPPFKLVGNLVVCNPEWKNAPYEQVFFYLEN